MHELRLKLEQISATAQTLVLVSNKDEADRLLGELDALVHDTRQSILDEWSVARTAHIRRKTSTEPSTIESLA